MSVSWPSSLFAPYLDVLLWPTYKASEAAKQTGNLFYTLAFITADGSGNPAFGGQIKLNDEWYANDLKELRDMGGDVVVSFGGAVGTELACASQNCELDDLVSKYQSVIDMYSLTHIDFDIEGDAVKDTKSVDLRNKAICALKQRNPGLHVSYTLPVLPTGLTNYGVDLLRNAVENGASINLVNVMAMDYGPGISLLRQKLLPNATPGWETTQSALHVAHTIKPSQLG
jgi:Glycosyl hydrolases family 18